MIGGHGASRLPTSEQEYYAQTRARLERAYLKAKDPRGGSGFRGDAKRWERARRPIASAIDRDGTFLDVGCANGLLMESLVGWAGEDGRRIEPYGLDLIDSLAELARERLPRWSGGIFTGNVMDWHPPFRFDFACANLEFVPPPRRRDMAERLLRKYLAPGGRLILTSYGSSRRPRPRTEPVADLMRGWGYKVAGEAATADTNGVVITRVAWTDAPHPPGRDPKPAT